MHRKSYINLAAHSSQKVTKRVPFYPINDHLGIKITTSRAVTKITPIYVHILDFKMPNKVADAKSYYNSIKNTDNLINISDKLRFYRLKNGLEQKDVANIIGISRRNYIGYENNFRDYYPAEIMDKLAKLYNVDIYALLDDYNTFLYNGQGQQIKAIRKRHNLTQKQFAKILDVQLGRIKRWEREENRMFKYNWEKLIKLM